MRSGAHHMVPARSGRALEDTSMNVDRANLALQTTVGWTEVHERISGVINSSILERNRSPPGKEALNSGNRG